jgi:hypothetical protein
MSSIPLLALDGFQGDGRIRSDFSRSKPARFSGMGPARISGTHKIGAFLDVKDRRVFVPANYTADTLRDLKEGEPATVQLVWVPEILPG